MSDDQTCGDQVCGEPVSGDRTFDRPASGRPARHATGPALAVACLLAALCGARFGIGEAHAQFGVEKPPKPNAWYHHETGGFDVYGVINDDGDRFELSCDVAYSKSGGATAMMTLGGLEPPPRTIVSVQIDAGSFEFSIDNHRVARTDCEACAKDYKAIWTAIRGGRWMTLKLKDGLSSSFSLKGASRVVPAKPCAPDYDRVPHKPAPSTEGQPYPDKPASSQ